MMGRPDYDAGDLVVHPEQPATTLFKKGGVYRVLEVMPHLYVPNHWGVVIEGIPSRHRSKAWNAARFRRIDPKPPEFFTGKIETVREDELV